MVHIGSQGPFLNGLAAFFGAEDGNEAPARRGRNDVFPSAVYVDVRVRAADAGENTLHPPVHSIGIGALQRVKGACGRAFEFDGPVGPIAIMQNEAPRAGVSEDAILERAALKFRSVDPDALVGENLVRDEFQ